MAESGRVKLIVLGAGASFGASRNGGLPCPLVNQILATAANAGITGSKYADRANAELDAELGKLGKSQAEIAQILGLPQQKDHLDVLRAFVKEQLGISEAQYQDPLDFEKLFALVEAQLLGYHGLLKLAGVTPKGPSSSDVLEMQFMLVLCGSILATTRDVQCEYHAALAEWLTPGDAVASFNYDLLIDRALRNTGRWFADDGYGLAFHRIGARLASDVSWRPPKATASYVKLWKPHGSLNWLYPVDSWESVVHLDLHGRPRRDIPALMYCLEDMDPQFEEHHPLYEWWERYEHQTEDYTYDLHSVIVPPTIAKPYRSFEPFIGPIWASILRSLIVDCEELFLIGYSIRPDDARSWWLFRKAASESQSLKRIVVVDPSDTVFERAVEAFSPRKVVRGPTTIESFARSLRG